MTGKPLSTTGACRRESPRRRPSDGGVRSAGSLVVFEITFDITLNIIGLDALAFVNQSFTAAEGKFNFYPSLDEIKFQRYEGYTLLVDLAFELQNFFFMGKQPSRAVGSMVEQTGMVVRSDAEIAEGELPAVRFDKGVGEIELGGLD